MKLTSKQHHIIIAVLSTVLVFWLGRLSAQYQIHAQLPPLQSVPEVNPKVPHVQITGIKDATIFATVNDSKIRLTSGNQVALPADDLSLQLNIKHLGYIGPKRSVIKHSVPDWARFVASKNGKYFYAVDEKSGKKLSVPSRVYFASEEEAISAGYKKRQR